VEEERNQMDKDNPMYKPLTPKSHPKKKLAEEQRKHIAEIRGDRDGSWNGGEGEKEEKKEEEVKRQDVPRLVRQQRDPSPRQLHRPNMPERPNLRDLYEMNQQIMRREDVPEDQVV
jgi:hypothetical protein